MMGSILVTHPGRQHSHQLATALQEAHLLYGYWTGVPAGPWPSRAVPRTIRRRMLKHESLDLPRALVREYPVSPVLRHTIGRLSTAAWASRVSHAADALFDQLTARALARRSDAPPRLAVCYENAARETFRVARRLGATTVLDAASVHHAMQDRLCAYAESPAVHARIVARKNEEIALADHVIAVSNGARESYLAAGVQPDRVVVVSPGVDLDLFAFHRRDALPDRPLHFVFAGNASPVKGMDVLLGAMRALAASGTACRLTIAGTARGTWHDDAPRNVEWTGRLAQRDLAALFSSADCLVLPSRFDSFGMVVVEALACGLPVIVSDRVGAMDVVRDGCCGWIVPAGDASALAACMRERIANPAELHAMRRAARARAERHTWQAYRRAVSTHLRTIVGESAP